MGIRIDALPATTIPTIEHILAAIKDGQTVKLTVAQILSLKTAVNLAYAASGSSGLAAYTDAKAALDILGQRMIAAESGVNAAQVDATRSLGLDLFKNKIINGNFAFNQRGAGNTVAASLFRADRWKAGASGCTAALTASGANFLCTITAGTIQQVIEDQYIDGGNYVLSWSGTAQARVSVGGGAFTSYAASPIQVNVGSALTQITIEFNTGTVDRVQFELGTVPTPYERRPRTIEYDLCRRYYQTSEGGSESCFFGAVVANYGISYPVAFPIRMRVTPTIEASYSISSNISTYITAWYASPRGYVHYMLAAAAGNAQMTWIWTASAEL